MLSFFLFTYFSKLFKTNDPSAHSFQNPPQISVSKFLGRLKIFTKYLQRKKYSFASAIIATPVNRDVE